ncbi:EF-hand domain-containing protein [Variovorax sp. Sphag1AA]|uniref:EF-hand domain-containing protein n=1 Tax=Variovorax sp. Sphag1AA TaxID=2587027 RepID=UPI001619791E|nr:EF-hand domain-containing protein [Variovorax sp. Sphag1AA]MBB3176358.1 Ca2+-binding EF-hand superfamily protein [Variovorax sp. Sphag1AA]
MTTVANANPLTRMLESAFTKFDRDKDGKLNAEEFGAFYEILKPGIALDEKGKPAISEQEYRSQMDGNSDGEVTLSEMEGTGVLMPANLTDESLDSMVQYLLAQMTTSASSAAGMLAESDTSDAPQDPHSLLANTFVQSTS